MNNSIKFSKATSPPEVAYLLSEQLNNAIAPEKNADLDSLIDYDNLTSGELKILEERIQAEMKRKEVLSRHHSLISQLPSGQWYTRVGGKKIQRKNLKDLEDYLIEIYSDEAMTLTSIYPAFLERRKLEVADTTWRKDMTMYEKYIKDSPLAKKKIYKIRLSDGYDFLQHCLEIKPDMKRKYWNNIRITLNMMMQFAIDHMLIERNPFEKMRPKKDLFEPPTKHRDGDTLFSSKEQINVCELAEQDSESTNNSIPLGIVLLFNLGLRDGELCALKWGDIESNLKGSYIHIQREMVANVLPDGKHSGNRILEHCKTPAGDRRLPLNTKALSLFKRIKIINKKNGLPTGKNDFIFLRIRKGKIVECPPRSIYTRLRKYCKASGMDVVKSPHDIRRTVLTNLYMAHMPLKKIQQFAGHSSLKQTMDYIRISDDELSVMEYLETLSDPQANTNVIPFETHKSMISGEK
ncbi:MAG: tyrosine-type recombinase/integrase [Lachnospiraceae bacterium]|nr:tyrosine-type recombinase/integrase [Lachnospiraceae bacterium]